MNATATHPPYTRSKHATEARFDDAAARGNHPDLDQRGDRIARRQYQAGARQHTDFRRCAVLEQMAHAYWNRALGIEYRLAGSVARALKHEQAASRNLRTARRLAARAPERLTFAELNSEPC